MANQSSAKGNPASTRMGNEKLKARRQRSWAKRQKEKELNRNRQREAEARNAVLRAKGEPTPWEVAKAARYARRHPQEQAA